AGDGEDARADGDPLGAEAARVAGSVEALVVVEDERELLAEEPDLVGDPRGERRMLADELAVRLGELPAVAHDRRERQHADVLEEGGAPDALDVLDAEL